MEEYEILDLTLRNVSLFIFTLMALVESIYQIKRSFYSEDKNWKHTTYPAIIGIFVATTFYPFSYFTWMPFQPYWGFLSIIYTGLICGRAANGGHSAYDKFGELFQSWVGRIAKKY